MIPVAKSLFADPEPALQRKMVFRIHRDAGGRWQARSDDGMTGGTFFTRDGAVRFVQRETVGLSALVLHIAPELTQGRAERRLASESLPS